MSPSSIQQSIANALEHHRAGRLTQAEAIYRRVLAQDPNCADALHYLGVLASQAGRSDIAADLITRAIRINPAEPTCYSNLGHAFQKQGQLDAAIRCYEQALGLSPHYADAHCNIGGALQLAGRTGEAIPHLRTAIALRPDFAEAHAGLGHALLHEEEHAAAIESFRRAIVLRPDYADAQMDLANALKDQGHLDEAIRCYRRALELTPDLAAAHSSLLYLLLYHPHYSPKQIYQEHLDWARRHAEPLASCIQPQANDPDPDRRLRIGYVSPSFSRHVTGMLFEPLLACHQHDDFEIVCYSDGLAPDEATRRMQRHADLWRSSGGLSDEQLARQVRQDRIDVLVDLTLHMAGSRLLVFARKPAPVQVSYLAYPATSGLRTMDYLVTDRYLDPPEQDSPYHTEEFVRLDGSYWCLPAGENDPEPGPLPAQHTGQVTFGSLNNFCKVNSPVIALWAEVLEAVPHSTLAVLINESDPEHSSALSLFRQHGIDPPRLRLVTRRRPREAYLALYQELDISLDPFPCNGHTTSLDSLWMGVPLVTLAGQTAFGRAGVSALSNLGLTELIAHSPEEYVRIAAELAGDLPRLAALRSGLRERMRSSPIMDAPGMTRQLEQAYRRMWHRWCAARRA